jgi:hypothetical protein
MYISVADVLWKRMNFLENIDVNKNIRQPPLEFTRFLVWRAGVKRWGLS